MINVIKELLAHDYDVLSIGRMPPPAKLCTSWIADLRNSGDLYEALRDAVGVVHLCAYQAPNLAPDAETFGNNVTSTYNVIRAAVDMGANNIALASSTAAFGFIYAETLWPAEYLPLDEERPSRAAPTSSMKQPTLELVKEFLPGGARIKEFRDPQWSCVDSTKALDTLGFTARHVWQNYLGRDAG